MNIIPTNNMTSAEQLITSIKLIFVISIILFLFDFNYTSYFLTICLAFIIIMYYIKNNKIMKENYVSTGIIETPQSLAFCNDGIIIDQPNIQIPLNQRLAMVNPHNDKTCNNKLLGCPNPKTLINPVVPPPAYDLDHWKDNNFINFSQINTAGTEQNMYLSGYAESTCCDYLKPGTKLVPRKDNRIENYSNRVQIRAPVPSQDINYVPSIENYSNRVQIRAPVPSQDINYVPSIENYQQPNKVYIKPNQPGWVNRSCGYNPEQIYTSNLPSNYPAGNCQQNPRLSEYNKNLFTQTITPGVYTRNQVNEPINSNIGISFQQQFEPLTCETDEDGDEVQYIQHDPRIIEPISSTEEKQSVPQARYDNVYDPRFYGYGTSYRSYNEPVTGQTRFMYDDINSVRMPNYITRSKIDHLPYADKYGPMEEGSEFGNEQTPNVRTLAQDNWLRDSLQFRNDLTERRMRKVNTEAWQRRQAPLGPYRV